jgi:hypothetical protein
MTFKLREIDRYKSKKPCFNIYQEPTIVLTKKRHYSNQKISLFILKKKNEKK